MRDDYTIRDRIVVICLGSFVVGTALSMYLYPGGTWWNREYERHAFCENFLCDLLHDPALNHRANPVGALAAKIAMLLLIVGFGVLWTMVERWVGHTPAARLVRILGIVGSFPLVLVPLTPSNHYPRLHTLAVLIGGMPSLLAFLLFVAALWRSAGVPAWLRAQSLLLGGLILLCLALYANTTLGSGSAVTFLPALERIAVVLTLVWLVSLLRQPRVPGSAHGGGPRRP